MGGKTHGSSINPIWHSAVNIGLLMLAHMREGSHQGGKVGIYVESLSKLS